jgi:hypothetical protein
MIFIRFLLTANVASILALDGVDALNKTEQANDNFEFPVEAAWRALLLAKILLTAASYYFSTLEPLKTLSTVMICALYHTIIINFHT